MIKRIHVNQHNLRKNKKEGTDLAPITIKTYKDNTYAKEVIIMGQDGKEAARLVYRPNKPLSCGATVWIETENEIINVMN